MNFQLCHSEQRRNRPPPLSFRAKKIIRLRMVFTVEEPAFLTFTSALHLRETDKTNLAQTWKSHSWPRVQKEMCFSPAPQCATLVTEACKEKQKTFFELAERFKRS